MNYRRIVETDRRLSTKQLRQKTQKGYELLFKNVRRLDPINDSAFFDISTIKWIQTTAVKAGINTPDIYITSQPRGVGAQNQMVSCYNSVNVPAIQVTEEFVNCNPPKIVMGVIGHEMGHLIDLKRNIQTYVRAERFTKWAVRIASLGGTLLIANAQGLHASAEGIARGVGIFIGVHILTSFLVAITFGFRRSLNAERKADWWSVKLLGTADGIRTHITSENAKALAEEGHARMNGIWKTLNRLPQASIYDTWEDASFAPRNKLEKFMAKAFRMVFHFRPSVSERLMHLDKYEAELAADKAAP